MIASKLSFLDAKNQALVEIGSSDSRLAKADRSRDFRSHDENSFLPPSDRRGDSGPCDLG